MAPFTEAAMSGVVESVVRNSVAGDEPFTSGPGLGPRSVPASLAA